MEKISILDWRSAVVKRIAPSISERVSIVAAPDHPLLLDGPDIIMASEGSLSAIFIQNKLEAAHPGRFYRRLSLARAALPPHAIFYLGGETLPDEKMTALFLDHFPSLALYSPEGRRIRNSAEEIDVRKITVKNGPAVRSPSELEARATILRKFHIIFRTSANNVQADKIRVTGREGSRNSEAMIVRTEKNLSPRGARETIYSETYGQHNLLVDDGYVYPAPVKGRIVKTEKFPRPSYDSLKFVRGLALAGWGMVDSKDDMMTAGRINLANRVGK